MIDICFSDSFGGLLIMARKHLGSDVLPLPLRLNHGYLSGDVIGNQERWCADNLRYYLSDIEKRKNQRNYRKNIRRSRKCYRMLERRIEKDEPIRVWISNTAHDRCNLYWLCHFAESHSPKISVVVCPGQEHGAPKANWAEFDDYRFVVACGKAAKELTEKEICDYANTWRELVEINAPLRVLVDNRLVSTREDYYDSFILQHIDSTPRSEIRVISQLLFENREMHEDFWSSRIDYLIRKGIVKICENNVDSYGDHPSRIIARTQ